MTPMPTYDPQLAPDYYERTVSMTMTDATGEDIVLVENQDGERYIVSLTEDQY